MVDDDGGDWVVVQRGDYTLLREELALARDLIEAWGNYADPFIQEKWDLAGDLARIKDVLNRVPGAEG